MRPPSPIRAVIFDVGGVLVRWTDHAPHRGWENRLGLAPGALGGRVWGLPASAHATVGRATLGEVWREAAADLGLSDEEAAALARDYFAGQELDAALVAFTRSLRPRVRVGLLSNAWPGSREVVSERYGLLALADVAVFSYEEGRAKPDPAIYRTTLERLRVRPEEAVFVDDAPECVAGAEAVGMRGVLHLETARTVAEVGRLVGAAA